RGIASFESAFSSVTRPASSGRAETRGSGRTPGRAALQQAPDEALQRIVELVRDALLHRDDPVVGDPDALGADLGATLRDVAVADAVRLLQVFHPILDVERVHLEVRGVDQEARADELVVEPVLAQDVADVLAEEALDALPELLHPV